MEDFLNKTIGDLTNHTISRSEATKLILDEIDKRSPFITMDCYDHVGDYFCTISASHKIEAQGKLLGCGRAEDIKKIDWDLSRLNVD